MQIRVHVRERKDRRFLQLAYTDPLTGQVKTKSAGTDKWKEAERAAARWESELLQAHGLAPVGWEVFRQRFEDEHLAGLEKDSKRGYHAALNHFERIIGTPRDISNINASIISQFRMELRTALSEASVQKQLRHFKAALNWAESVGMIAKAPKITTTAIRQSERGRPLTLFEFCRLLRAAPDERYYQLLIGLWLSGLRLGEALKLSFEPPVQLVLGDRYPIIRFTVSGQKGRREEDSPLTPAMSRFVRRFERTAGPIFGITQNLHGVSRAISDIGRQAGVKVSPTKYASAHDLRRSFGTRWALRVHPFVLQKMMRHASLQTTMAYYVRLGSNQLAEQIWSSQSVHASVHGAADQAVDRGVHRSKNPGL